MKNVVLLFIALGTATAHAGLVEMYEFAGQSAVRERARLKREQTEMRQEQFAREKIQQKYLKWDKEAEISRQRELSYLEQVTQIIDQLLSVAELDISFADVSSQIDGLLPVVSDPVYLNQLNLVRLMLNQALVSDHVERRVALLTTIRTGHAAWIRSERERCESRLLTPFRRS